LSTNDVLSPQSGNGLQDLHLFVPQGLAVQSRRRLHREIAQHLEKVVLDDIADRARRVVEGAAALDAEVFRHRDLHALDVGTIPEGFHERIRKAKKEHVVNSALSEVVVDPEDVALHEHTEQDPIQFSRRDEVRAEGFLDDDAGSFRASRSSQLFDDGPEERGWDREVVRGVRCVPERAASERLERRRLSVVAVDVSKQSAQLRERVPVQPPVLLDALLRARAQLVEGPARLGDADDRHVEVAALGHRLQRGEDFLVRQIARRPEKHQRVGVCVAHLHLLVLSRESSRRTNVTDLTNEAAPPACSRVVRKLANALI
jgi:hypothetical protein